MPLTPPFFSSAAGVAASTSVDTVTWRFAVTPSTGEGGIAVKIPDANYGVTATPYTSGEFVFAVLEEGAGDATDSTGAGAVLWRVDAYGASGGNGGFHIALGYRKSLGAAPVGLWIQPYQADAVPMRVQVGAADGNGATALMVNAAGQVLVGQGALSSLAIAPALDTDTGFYFASDIIAFVTGGTQRLAISTTNLAVAAGINITFGASTGTMLGTATNQKIGFWGATPVNRPTGVAVTAAGIHAALVTIGLIAA